MAYEGKPPNLRQRWKSRLEPLARLDKNLTLQLSVCASKSSSFGKFRPHMKGLEISCHGIPWLGTCLVLLWCSTTIESKQLLVNILTALILDIILVALIKAICRRARPACNDMDMFATFALDNYSFPSGHTSRALMYAFLFYYLNLLGIFMSLTVIVWAAAVSSSRVLLGRHHIGDVMAGIILGLAEGWFMSVIWFSEETTESILHTFSMFESFHAVDVSV